MDWNSLIRGFEDYLMLERSLSPHSIDAYESILQIFIDRRSDAT